MSNRHDGFNEVLTHGFRDTRLNILAAHTLRAVQYGLGRYKATSHIAVGRSPHSHELCQLD